MVRKNTKKIFAILIIAGFLLNSISFFVSSENTDYVYCAGERTRTVWKIRSSDMVKVDESISYGGTIWTLAEDDDYVYCAGESTQTVWKIQKSDMSKVAESASYGGDIWALAVDDEYVYAAGKDTDAQTVWKLLKSNLSKVAESIAYGLAIYALVEDDDHIYIGGYTPGRVWKIRKSDMVKVSQSIMYPGGIFSLAEDDDYVYVGGQYTKKVWKLQKSDMSKVAESANYGGTILDIVEDAEYIYAGGVTTYTVWKLLKSNLSKVAESIAYGNAINDIDVDADHVYVGGVITNRVWKLQKSDLLKVDQSAGYGGRINAITTLYEYEEPPWTNSNPVASSPNPPDAQIGVTLSLDNYYNHFNISITDANNLNQSVNVTWRTNESGTWLDMGYNESIEMNATFYCTNVSWVDTNDTKYWWSVNVSDNHSTKGWGNHTYSFTTTSEPGVWWDSDWNYFKTITIESDMIDSILKNFPILVPIDDATGDKCKSAGEDIRFILPDNTTELYYEIDTWVDGADRLVWVNVTSISSSTDTTILMYYGNPDASDNQNPNDVWNSNFMMVQHMNDSTTSTVLDSTINNNDGTKKGANEPIETSSGKIDDAQDFDGSNDYVDTTDINEIELSDATFSFWAKADDLTNDMDVITKGEHTTSQPVLIWRDETVGGVADVGGGNTNTISVLTYDGSTQHWIAGPSGSWNDMDFHHFVVVIDATNNNLIIYKDGSLLVSNTKSWNGIQSTAAKVRIGDATPSGKPFNGIIDEVRISDIARSTAWVKASFHTMNQTTGFLAIGSEQSSPNNAPTQSGEVPGNSSTGVSVTPQLYVLCTDADNDNMDANWWSNSSGAWLQFASNWTSFANNTNITQQFPNASAYSTTYYWGVNLTDGIDWCNETYHFTTRSHDIPDAPSAFTASAWNRTQINLSWIGAGTNKTYIEWYTSEGWARGNGTEIYNNTGSSYNHQSLRFGTSYYYQAWSYNQTDKCFSITNSTASNSTYNNSAPVIYGVNPANASTYQSRYPRCNITVVDINGDLLNVSFYENTTGSWIHQQTNESVINNSNVIWSNYSNASVDNTTYWWSVNVTDGYNWTNATYSFTVLSLPKPLHPTDFQAVRDAVVTQINLSWTKGTGADKTVIVKKVGSYPVNRSDGTVIYNGTTITYEDGAVVSGTHYFYRAWSYAAAGDYKWYSDGYDEDSVIALAPATFDIRDILIIDDVVPDLQISVVVENKGDILADISVRWVLIRLDDGSVLDLGADTFAVSPFSNVTYTITPTTSYVGSVIINFTGDGAYASGMFSTKSPSVPIPPGSSGLPYAPSPPPPVVPPPVPPPTAPVIPSWFILIFVAAAALFVILLFLLKKEEEKEEDKNG